MDLDNLRKKTLELVSKETLMQVAEDQEKELQDLRVTVKKIGFIFATDKKGELDYKETAHLMNKKAWETIKKYKLVDLKDNP